MWPGRSTLVSCRLQRAVQEGLTRPGRAEKKLAESDTQKKLANAEKNELLQRNDSQKGQLEQLL